MADTQVLLFDERFLDRHAGAIITDAEVAIVELVANAWDAWARRVDIHWAGKGDDKVFTIQDDGKGLTEAQFLRRWGTIDYNKLAEEGPIPSRAPTSRISRPVSPTVVTGVGDTRLSGSETPIAPNPNSSRVSRS